MKRASWIATAWAPCVAITVQVGHALHIQPWMLDDAFIFFRYAENLAAGHGPVYNPGERVEGYTSFLWVVLLAAGHALGADTVLLAQVLGSLFAIACIGLAWRCGRWLPEVEPATAALAALLVGTFGGFTPWAVSGMEVTLFAFATALAVLLAAAGTAPAWLLGGLGALLVMTRPEGLLVVAFLFVQRALQQRNRRDFAVMMAGFAALVLPWFVWRLAYYGYPLPNTFYAKVGTTWAQLGRGASYTGRFLVAAAPHVALVVAAVVTRRWGRHAGRLRSLPLLLALYALAVLVLGGDVMPAFRFFAPIVPLLAVAAAIAARALFGARFAVLAVAITAGWGVGGMRWVPEIHDKIRDDLVAEVGETVGLWLRQTARPDALLATNTAGSIPYYSGLRTIDMFGLNDAHIAHRRMPAMGRGIAGHEKHDGRYVMSRRPDYVQFGSSLGGERPAFSGDYEVYSTPEFQENYELVTYRLTGPRGVFPLRLYERIHTPP